MASQNMALASTTSKLMAAAAAGDGSPHHAHDGAAGSIGTASTTLGSSAAVTALNASSVSGRSSGHSDAAGSAAAVEGMCGNARATRGGAVLTAAQVGGVRWCVLMSLAVAIRCPAADTACHLLRASAVVLPNMHWHCGRKCCSHSLPRMRVMLLILSYACCSVLPLLLPTCPGEGDGRSAHPPDK